MAAERTHTADARYGEAWLRRRLQIADDGNASAGGSPLSCFVCGQSTLPDDVAVGHLVHTDVVCCKHCKAATEIVNPYTALRLCVAALEGRPCTAQALADAREVLRKAAP